MSFADDVKTDLLRIIHFLDPADFSKNPDTDFSRKRKHDFYSLIEFILSMETGSVRDELLNYTAAYKACIYFIRLRNTDTLLDIESLIRKNVLPIRPDRIYARQHNFRSPVSFTYRFSRNAFLTR